MLRPVSHDLGEAAPGVRVSRSMPSSRWCTRRTAVGRLDSGPVPAGSADRRPAVGPYSRQIIHLLSYTERRPTGIEQDQPATRDHSHRTTVRIDPFSADFRHDCHRVVTSFLSSHLMDIFLNGNMGERISIDPITIRPCRPFRAITGAYAPSHIRNRSSIENR